MKKQNLKIYLPVLLGVFGVSIGVFLFANSNLSSSLGILSSANEKNYSITLDSTNAPISIGEHTVKTELGNPVKVDFLNASLLTGGFIHLNGGGSLILKTQLSGVNSVTATFSGSVHAECGLKENSTLSISKLESGQKSTLGDYMFNYVKLVADEDSDIYTAKLDYSCSIPEPQVVFGADVEAIGAKVYGVKDDDILGNTVRVHVDPFLGNTIESVKVRGTDVPYNSDLGVYEYEAGTDDVLVVKTSLTDHQTITVQNYIVDEDTGVAMPDGDSYEEMPILSADGYSYKVVPMNKPGYVVDKDYYMSVRDSEHTSVNFYYSKESKYDPAKTSTSLSGSGTANDPFLIKTCADYLYFASTYDASTTANNGKYFKLTRSIDLTGLTCEQFMFGKSGVAFQGNLDGSNTRITYSISGTAVNQSLIYNINGVVKNLSLYGLNHNSTRTAPLSNFINPKAEVSNISNFMVVEQEGGNAVSGLIGDCWGGHVLNCTNYANISDVNKAYNKTSSILGVVEKDGGIVEECFNFGNVNGNTLSAGIAPFANDGVTLSLKNVYNFGIVTNAGSGDSAGIILQPDLAYVSLDGCYNFGEVKGVNNVRLGGIANYVIPDATEAKTISNCYNFGKIAQIGTARAGGIISNITRTRNVEKVLKTYLGTVNFVNCKNYGDVTCNVTDDSGTGGIVGDTCLRVVAPTGQTLKDVLAAKATFTNCENYGYVDGTQRSGGIVGWAVTAEFENCVNCGDFGTRSGAASLQWNGGIVGTSYNQGDKISNIKVNNCRNFGTIKGSATAIGGIAGSPSGNASFTITNCQNYGHVIAGTTYAGGIVGQASGGTVKGSIANCINYGDIQAGTDYCGGIAGNPKVGTVTMGTNTNYGTITCPGSHKGSIQP
ncbi:MAG: hypothetical protein MJ227_01300 [Bacilli bacterium]|nr:hypothetical protein [Bacilli bacterium]